MEVIKYKNQINEKFEKILFFAALFMELLSVYINSTGYIRFVSQDCIKYICLFCVCFSVAKIILFDIDFWISHIFSIFFVLLVTFFSVKSSGVLWYDSVFLFVLLIVSARNIDFVDICDFIFKVTLVFFIITLIGYYCGYIYVPPMDPDGRIRFYLGFSYVSIGHIRFIGTAFCGIYSQHHKRKKGVSWLFLVLIFLMNCYLYIWTDTRLAFLFIDLALVLYILIYKLNILKIRWKKIIRLSLTFLSLILMIGSIIIPRFYNSDKPIWRFINYNLMNTRLGLSKVALEIYHVGLWGQSIRTYNDIEGYFYIDSGYLHYILLYGLLFVAMLLLVYLLVLKNAINNKDWFLVIWIACLIIYNVMNEWIVSVDKCACAFAIWNLIDNRKKSEQKMVSSDIFLGFKYKTFGGHI